MWKVKKFNTNSITTWADSHIQTKFLKYEKPILLPNTPFDIEITSNVYRDIKKIYVNNLEKGGIIFCKIIQLQDKFRLQTSEIVEVKNVFEPSEKHPGRDKSNTYRPDANFYLSLLENNFSQQDHNNILFPIHFHTHPTQDKEKTLEYYKSHWQLNTSGADQDRARERYAEFNSVKFRYLSAIITGHDDDHNILFYAQEVTPLDFMTTKFKRLQSGVSKIGSELSSLSEDKNKQRVIKDVVDLLGSALIAFNSNMIDYAANMFEDKEYFGSLNPNSSTIINIPFYKKDDDEA